MKIYKNGDRCPCCGTVLKGKTEEWLAEFSQLVADLGLPDWPPPELRGVAEEDPSTPARASAQDDATPAAGPHPPPCGGTFPVRGEGMRAAEGVGPYEGDGAKPRSDEGIAPYARRGGSRAAGTLIRKQKQRGDHG